MTHDQSFKWSSRTSVNSWVKAEELLPRMFGARIKRIVNWTITTQQLFPNVPVLASKINFKSAFQGLHLNAATAVQTCTQIVDIGILLMLLWLSFRGKPHLYKWGINSDMICNPANTILHHNNWDPYNLLAPNQALVPPHALLKDNIPFGHGAELIVNIPINPWGMHNIYIDDIIALTIDISGTDNATWGQAAALIAIFATAHPYHPNEPIPCKSMDARDKLPAKAGLTEMKIILGCFFYFRQLQIFLPENK
jgi:hypothetical protein